MFNWFVLSILQLLPGTLPKTLNLKELVTLDPFKNEDTLKQVLIAPVLVLVQMQSCNSVSFIQCFVVFLWDAVFDSLTLLYLFQASFKKEVITSQPDQPG